MQSWIDTGDMNSQPNSAKAPFIILPPVARVDGGQSQALRIMYSGAPLAADRESLYWLNVLDIPPELSGTEGKNYLQFAVRSRLKLFFRPKGLKGDQISLFAKMGAVCDVYDAITSNRPYKSGWDPAESLRKMAEWANGHFDGKVFQAFVKSLGIYPIGSLVKLTSGRLGVVVEQTGKSLTTPSVKVFFSTKSNLRITPEVIDLSSSDVSEKIVSREDPAKWRFADLNELWSGFNKSHW